MGLPLKNCAYDHVLDESHLSLNKNTDYHHFVSFNVNAVTVTTTINVNTHPG